MTDFTKYKLCPSWSLSELTDLCCGLYPSLGRENFDEINWAREMICRECLAGDLPFKDPIDASDGDILYGHNRFFHPADAAKWAIPLFPKFPKELHDLIEQPQSETKQIPPYLDPSHSAYVEEFAIAHKAWEAVLLPCPDRPKKGSRKRLIREWLDKNYSNSELCSEAKNRISTLLNPDKNGGVTKSV